MFVLKKVVEACLFWVCCLFVTLFVFLISLLQFIIKQIKANFWSIFYVEEPMSIILGIVYAELLSLLNCLQISRWPIDPAKCGKQKIKTKFCGKKPRTDITIEHNLISWLGPSQPWTHLIWIIASLLNWDEMCLSFAWLWVQISPGNNFNNFILLFKTLKFAIKMMYFKCHLFKKQKCFLL